ncbi:hypothetical protein AAFF_G00376860 [Aldrovandia affinis]|uniref:Uncharacterized protein n=1 Tax=Aldrovandia affinis TaxID=143900 RepID=A0AAD7WM36_9TELE|nr:hypothetical protein AAFF_G00376860 [Aldrovandia affinis]
MPPPVSLPLATLKHRKSGTSRVKTFILCREPHQAAMSVGKGIAGLVLHVLNGFQSFVKDLVTQRPLVVRDAAGNIAFVVPSPC